MHKMFFLHIPKCAGTAFAHQIKAFHFPFDSEEACYEDHKSMPMITMLRNPRTHVLSQYFHCKTSNDHAYGHKYMPVNFSLWIEAWSKNYGKYEEGGDPFCCYNPSNMQAARLSCGKGTSEKFSHF